MRLTPRRLEISRLLSPSLRSCFISPTSLPAVMGRPCGFLSFLAWSIPAALVHESELARNEPDSQVHHLPRAYDDGLPSSAIRLRM